MAPWHTSPHRNSSPLSVSAADVRPLAATATQRDGSATGSTVGPMSAVTSPTPSLPNALLPQTKIALPAIVCAAWVESKRESKRQQPCVCRSGSQTPAPPTLAQDGSAVGEPKRRVSGTAPAATRCRLAGVPARSRRRGSLASSSRARATAALVQTSSIGSELVLVL